MKGITLSQAASSRSRPNPRKPKVHQDSRTKFDIWLEDHLSSGETVDFVLKNRPLWADTDGKAFIVGKILTVDRYFVYMEIRSSDADADSVAWVPVWIAKDQIISAA